MPIPELPRTTEACPVEHCPFVRSKWRLMCAFHWDALPVPQRDALLALKREAEHKGVDARTLSFRSRRYFAALDEAFKVAKRRPIPERYAR